MSYKTIVTFTNCPQPYNRDDTISQLQQAYRLISAIHDNIDVIDNVHDDEVLHIYHLKLSLKELLVRMSSTD